MVNTKDLNPAEVLAALYNDAKPLGMGMLHYNPEGMTIEQAQKELDDNQWKYFDYLHGRVMKVNLKNPDNFDERLYDRDNGYGAAHRTISKIVKP